MRIVHDICLLQHDRFFVCRSGIYLDPKQFNLHNVPEEEVFDLSGNVSCLFTSHVKATYLFVAVVSVMFLNA